LLLVSCGPSAGLWERVLATLPDDSVVACVKQAIFLCRRRAAIHFFNPYNAQRYWPHNRHALRVDVRDHFAPRAFNAADLVFTLDPATTGDLSRSLAATGRWEDHTIARSGTLRPWGPGILHDVAFHLTTHLGFAALHTVGWDVIALPAAGGAGPRRVSHFYDPPRGPAPGVATFEWHGQDPRSYRRRALLRHLRGAMYNRVPKADVQGEVGAVVASLPGLADWLASAGTQLTIHTRLGGTAVDARLRPHLLDWTESA
jgi:hypothetical protein